MHVLDINKNMQISGAIPRLDYLDYYRIVQARCHYLKKAIEILKRVQKRAIKTGLWALKFGL